MSVGGKPVHRGTHPCIPRLFAHQSCVATPYSPEWKAVKSCFLALPFLLVPCGNSSSEAGKKRLGGHSNIGGKRERDPSFLQLWDPFLQPTPAVIKHKGCRVPPLAGHN